MPQKTKRVIWRDITVKTSGSTYKNRTLWLTLQIARLESCFLGRLFTNTQIVYVLALGLIDWFQCSPKRKVFSQHELMFRPESQRESHCPAGWLFCVSGVDCVILSWNFYSTNKSLQSRKLWKTLHNTLGVSNLFHLYGHTWLLMTELWSWVFSISHLANEVITS